MRKISQPTKIDLPDCWQVHISFNDKEEADAFVYRMRKEQAALERVKALGQKL